MFWLFIVYPLLEILVLAQFVSRFGFLDALVLMLLSAFTGLLVMWIQGRATLFSLQNSLSRGQMPAGKILNRTLVMFGGFLIFLPGIISDIIGVLFILPVSRHFLAYLLRGYIAGKVAQGGFRFYYAGMGGKANPRMDTEGDASQERPVGPVDVLEVKPEQVKNTRLDP